MSAPNLPLSSSAPAIGSVLAVKTTGAFNPRTMLGSAMTMLLGLIAMQRSRRQLEQLDARLLDDIGYSAEEAQREAIKLNWNVPDHWLR